MNLANAAERQPVRIAYPNIAGTLTSAGSQVSPPMIELGPYEALFDRTGTGLAEGSSGWWRRGFSMTSACVFFFSEVPAVLRADERMANPIIAAAQSARDQIRFIQAALGLSVSHLAVALGVERQTIYNWLQAEEPAALQTRTRTRLAQMAELSRRWNQRCPRPAGRLAATLDLGRGTLLDLLKQTPVDGAELQTAMDVLAAHIDGTRTRRHKRVQGLTPPPETSDDRILRIATGIPLNTAPDED